MAHESSYTEEKADLICEWIASGKTLNKLSQVNPEINRATVYRWFKAIPEFKQKYEEARTFQWETWYDEIIDIGNDDSNDTLHGPKGPVSNHAAVQRAKLKTDDRKWLLSKLLPRRFGDKPEGEKPEGEKNNSLRPIVLNVLPKPDN